MPEWASYIKQYAYNVLLLLVLPLLIIACASSKAGMKSPELPAKHWLDESPGVPIENKEKLNAVIPELYDPNKSFNFDECVFLTIQQSPALVNSAVDIEIKRIEYKDAVWRYLPEPQIALTVSNNITRYNMGVHNTPSDYGAPKFRVDFYVPFPNPVQTYFEQKARDVIVNLAISTHRKAVGEVILNIANSYLRLQAQRRILEAQKELLPLCKELVEYWKQVEKIDGRQGVSLNVAMQAVKENELIIEKSKTQEAMSLTKLKMLAGVDPTHRFSVNTDDIQNIIADFDGSKLSWEKRWETSEDDLLLRMQLKLNDFNIMLAWAQYVPTMGFSINQSPPNGQYQPPGGQDDYFIHFNFNLPILDWGRRYRGVQNARMKKAQAFHDMANKRTQYSSKWVEAQQAVALAKTEYQLQQTSYETAEMRFKEAQISFNEGSLELPQLITQQKEMVNAKIKAIQGELEYKLAIVNWMYIANVLQERFLGIPKREL